MARVFSPRADLVLRAGIIVVLAAVVAIIWVAIEWYRSEYYTGIGYALHQPVPFSHQHHVGGEGFDCRYCHFSVTRSSSAGIPTTDTCMTCHWQLWTQAAVLAPVRASWRTARPIRWQRVHVLPGYVYFDHSIHVSKGLGCSTCHGPVDRMALVYRVASLEMRWCLDCHQAPAKNLRPVEQIFNMEWQPPPDQQAAGRELQHRYQVESLTSCSTCHR